MKRIVVFVVLLCVSLSAQVSVTQIQTLELGTTAMRPVFSADGNQILFTSSNGLFYHDLNMKHSTRFADSGYDYTMDHKGAIRFRVDTYENKFKLNSIHLYQSDTKATEIILDKKRFDVLPAITDHGIYYVEQKQVKNDFAKANAISKPVAFAYDHAIMLYSYGTTKIMKPAGEDKFYIWPSVSPDNTQLCFVDRNDLFITDLDGNVQSVIKEARAPKWSPDGKWIAFMRDSDDGHTFISSEIYVVSKDGKTIIQLTDTDDVIEMSPSWSPDGKQIICEDAANAELILLTLDIQ